MTYQIDILGRAPVRKDMDDFSTDLPDEDWKGEKHIKISKVSYASWGGKPIEERIRSAQDRKRSERRAGVRMYAEAGLCKAAIAKKMRVSYRLVQSDVDAMGIKCKLGKSGPDPKGGK